MKWKLFSVLAVLVIALAACGNYNNDRKNDDTAKDNVENTRYNNNAGDGMVGDRDHTLVRNSERDQNRTTNHEKYEVAKEAADRITDEIDEIDHAYVLTTNNNAYVAATLNDDNNIGNNNMARNDRADNDHARNDMMDNDRADNDNANLDNDRVRNDRVITARDEDDVLTENVKEKIGDIVRSVDNNIDHVYVSTNPDFVNMTNNYVNDVNNGHPIAGFFDQFGDMLERIFPQNRR